MRQDRVAESFRDQYGNEITLEDYEGKVVVLNFWATWCPPCRREMPSMERLHQSMGEEDFKVIAVNQMEDIDHVFAYTGPEQAQADLAGRRLLIEEGYQYSDEYDDRC